MNHNAGYVIYFDDRPGLVDVGGEMLQMPRRHGFTPRRRVLSPGRGCHVAGRTRPSAPPSPPAPQTGSPDSGRCDGSCVVVRFGSCPASWSWHPITSSKYSQNSIVTSMKSIRATFADMSPTTRHTSNSSPRASTATGTRTTARHRESKRSPRTPGSGSVRLSPPSDRRSCARASVQSRD